MAVKEGGPDPEMNFALQSAIERARAYNMPNDNIKRSIDNALGVGGSSILMKLLMKDTEQAEWLLWSEL